MAKTNKRQSGSNTGAKRKSSRSKAGNKRSLSSGKSKMLGGMTKPRGTSRVVRTPLESQTDSAAI